MHIHNFKFEESHYIDEIRSTYLSYTHPSGLKVIKINNLDPQNVASILFQTIPENSNGCPHILEHTVLCGSKKYPVKDPFFSMLRRSIAGFANAFTGSDFTCYPFAAHVKEDFFHLFDVYLDAVFHPLLEKGSFLQEGFRLTEEGYKGIVFNEMKQGHSSLHDRFYHSTLVQLFPNTPYRFDSGGIPKEIVKLTHEDLVAFHKEFYHPSHAIIFLYGNLDIDEQLCQIEASIRELPPLTHERPARIFQPRFEAKKIHHTFYPAKEEDQEEHLTIGFMLEDQQNKEALLEIQYVKKLLADHDGCPMHRAIKGENLASSVDVLLDTEVLQPYLFFIFKDVKDPKKLIETFDKTLATLYREGFDEEAQTSALHQLKLSFLNTVEDGYPTGLVLFFRGILPYLNGGDPLELLRFKDRIRILEEKMGSPQNLKERLKKSFIDNTHRVEVHFSPKKNLLEEELPIPPPLNPERLRQIEEEKNLIDKKQSHTQSASVLPILKIQHLPSRPPTYEIEKLEGDIPIFVHKNWTNGLSYLHIIIDLPSFKGEDWHYLGLMLRLLGEIGTKKRGFEELLEKRESLLSSLGFHLDAVRDRMNLIVEAQFLSEDIKEAYDLVQEILQETQFHEKERILEIIKDTYTYLKARFTQRSVTRCILKSKSRLRSGYQALEDSKGFSFYLWLKKELEKPIEHTIHNLSALFSRLLAAKGKLEMALSTDLEQVPMFHLKRSQSEDPFTISPLHPDEKEKFFGYSIPIQANENAFSFLGFTFDDPLAPVARVMVQLVKHLQLHPLLREKNGAYGASMSLDLDQGLLTMYTSCDPHIEATYEIFQTVLDPIKEGQYSDEDLYEAKLAALQKTEEISPINICAFDQYLRERMGRTVEKRLEDRNRLIQADRSAIRECVLKILGNLKEGISVTLASKKALSDLKRPVSTLVEL
jgi:hypothetical protein